MKIKNSIILFFLLAISQLSLAQTRWAAEVIEVSSQFKDKKETNSWKASQILGKPDVLPEFKSSRCAWSPEKKNSEEIEYIHVSFASPIEIRQVAICESHNTGSITKVTVYDTEMKKHVLYKNKDPQPTNNTFFHLELEELTEYKVLSLKVELKTSAVDGYNHIDAIGVSNEKAPIKPQINLPPVLEKMERESLGPWINSIYDEVYPVISPEGNMLFFDRKNHPENTKGEKENDDIWYSELKDGEWQRPVKMKAPLNNENNNFVCSVLPGGNELLLANTYSKSGFKEHGVSYSAKDTVGWSYPLNIEIDNLHNYSQFCEYRLASNGRVLLLSYEGGDAEGKEDVYVSFFRNGKWSKPKNLGADINTAQTELTPFLAADNKTLYFSSDGYSGYGEKDIYMSRRLDDSWTRWSEPVNLGPDINSDDWDMSYTVDETGDNAYFVSYKGSYGRSADIYTVRLIGVEVRPEPVVIIRGRVLDSKTNLPLKAQITYESLPNGVERGVMTSDPKDGSYEIILPISEYYGFYASTEGYLSVSENIDLHSTETYVLVEQDLYLTPVKIGESIRLNNIFFERSRYLLLDASFPELDRLATLMKENPTMKVEIEGHTDIIGDSKQNLLLSQLRAKAVVDYLISQGVDESKISSIGYGDTQPKTTDRDSSSAKLNRRVEFRIIHF